MKVLAWLYMVLLCTMVALLCVGLLMEMAPGFMGRVGKRIAGTSRKTMKRMAAAATN